jgi:spermidine synthase
MGWMFALTGCAGLWQEQGYEKLLTTLVGGSTHAAAVVLAVYFLGLTAGGLLYAAVIRPRVHRPLSAYGHLEGAAALWAAAVALSSGPLVAIMAPAFEWAGDRTWAIFLLRALLAALWIAPPTMAMGATFPAVADALERQLGAPAGNATVRLYALNLAGAIGGALLGPFVMFPLVGVDGILLSAALLQLVVLLRARALSQTLPPQLPAAPQPTRGAAPWLRRPPMVLAALALFSGLASFSLEVLWTHLVAAVLGNSVYAFAAMLVAVLSGLGLGGALAGRWWGLGHVPPAAPSWALLATAAVLVGTLPVWPHAPHLLALMGSGVHSFAAAESLRLLLAFLLLTPAATALGMTYPMIFRLEAFPPSEVGASAGLLGAINAVGCALGALGCGFVLIPWLGSEQTLQVLTAVLLAAAVVAAGASAPRALRAVGPGAALLGLVLVALPPWDRLALTSGEHVYFARSFVTPQSVLRFFHEDTAGGITTVVEQPVPQGQGPRVLLTNGKFQGTDAGETAAQMGFALAPALFVQAHQRALNIGLGTGHTAHALHALGFDQLDVAEMAPGVLTAARDYFGHLNHRVLEAPNTHVIVDDARNALLRRATTYDLVSTEISSVWFAGSTNLYSTQFYALVRSRLSPRGVFQQWIQLHHIGLEELLTVLGSLRAAFPAVSLWIIGTQGVLVATQQPQVVNAAGLRGLVDNAAALDIPAGTLEARLESLLASCVLWPPDVDALLQRFPPVLNTDQNRQLEYATPRFNHSDVDHYRQNVESLAGFSSFVRPVAEPGVPADLAAVVARVGRRQVLENLHLVEAAP